jgi:MFS family permease
MSLLTSIFGSQVGPAKPGASALRTDLRKIVWEGALANIFVVLTSGAFVTGMALTLGANDFEIGLLVALPFLAQAAQPLSSLLPGVNEKRKRITLLGVTLARQTWLLAVPLLFVKGEWVLPLFLLVVTLSSVANMLVAPIWLGWISDIVPRDIRGRFFGVRSAGVAVTTLMFSILGSLVLDWFEARNQAPGGFTIILAVAALAGAVASLVLSRVSDRPAPPRAVSVAVRGDWLRPVRDPEFRRILRLFFTWNFAIGISAPFFAPHMLLNLKMSFFMIGLYSAGQSVIAVISSRPWGFLIDRFGSRSVLIFCATGIGLIPLFWLPLRPDYLWLLVVELIYSSFLWAGFNLAAFTLPIDTSPRDDRTYYLAWFATITGLAFFAASVLGGLLAESWSYFSWPVGKQIFLNYHIIFVISAGLRMASAGLLYVLTEPSDRKIPMMVQLMGYAVLKHLSLGRQIMPFAVEGTDNQTDDERGKAPGPGSPGSAR